MADYSWVALRIATDDGEVLDAIRGEWSYEYDATLPSDTEQGVTMVEGEASYGMIEGVEALLMERGIAFSRYSDGKYEYDGDEAHWKPGMDEPRVFPMLNNGGRVFSEFEYREALNSLPTDAELGALVREHFDFAPAVPMEVPA